MPASGPHAERLVLCREPYYRNLYALCFESDGRYFRAERPIRLSNAEIYRQIREHMEKVNLHPAIVKKASFVKYVNWYKDGHLHTVLFRVWR